MIHIYQCVGFGHELPTRKDEPPKVCLKCKSPYWNKHKWKEVKIMKDLFRRIVGKFKESHDEEWLGRVRRLKQEFDAIDVEVQTAMKNKPSEELLPAFSRACTDIPVILTELRGRLPSGEHMKPSWQIFQEGLNAYLSACEHFRKSVLDNDEREYVRGIKEMKDAEMLLKQAKSLFK